MPENPQSLRAVEAIRSLNEIEFYHFIEGLTRVDGRSWPEETKTSFRVKVKWMLPIIGRMAHLNSPRRVRDPTSLQEAQVQLLIKNLLKQAS